jgi:hypothetical protein
MADAGAESSDVAPVEEVATRQGSVKLGPAALDAYRVGIPKSPRRVTEAAVGERY